MARFVDQAGRPGRLPGRPETIQSNRAISPYQGSVGMKRPPMRSLWERACPQEFTGIWHGVKIRQCLGGVGSKTLLLQQFQWQGTGRCGEPPGHYVLRRL